MLSTFRFRRNHWQFLELITKYVEKPERYGLVNIQYPKLRRLGIYACNLHLVHLQTSILVLGSLEAAPRFTHVLPGASCFCQTSMNPLYILVRKLSNQIWAPKWGVHCPPQREGCGDEPLCIIGLGVSRIRQNFSSALSCFKRGILKIRKQYRTSPKPDEHIIMENLSKDTTLITSPIVVRSLSASSACASWGNPPHRDLRHKFPTSDRKLCPHL